MRRRALLTFFGLSMVVSYGAVASNSPVPLQCSPTIGGAINFSGSTDIYECHNREQTSYCQPGPSFPVPIPFANLTVDVPTDLKSLLTQLSCRDFVKFPDVSSLLNSRTLTTDLFLDAEDEVNEQIATAKYMEKKLLNLPVSERNRLALALSLNSINSFSLSDLTGIDRGDRTMRLAAIHMNMADNILRQLTDSLVATYEIQKLLPDVNVAIEASNVNFDFPQLTSFIRQNRETIVETLQALNVKYIRFTGPSITSEDAVLDVSHGFSSLYVPCGVDTPGTDWTKPVAFDLSHVQDSLLRSKVHVETWK